MRTSLVLCKNIGGRNLKVCRQPLQDKVSSSSLIGQVKEDGPIRRGYLVMAKEKKVDNDTEGSGLQIAGEEVEVKLRIPDSASFAAAKSLFLPSFKNVLNQENHFFDGSNEELSSQKVVLRIRFYNSDQKAVITCKGKQVLKDGIGRAPEEEEEIDVQKARNFIQDPDAMLLYDSNLITKLKDEFEFKNGLKYLGGFDNQRSVYEWRGYSLELDLTSYPWGCLHEIECETDKPEDLKQILEKLLTEQSIPFSDAKKSKFANFKDQTLE
jgi:uncharacterized protein YjbK